MFVAETDENLIITNANEYAGKLAGGDITGRHLRSCLVEFQSIPDVSDIADEGVEFILNYRSAGGLPYSFKTTVMRTDAGYLFIGEHNTAELDSLRFELININNQLNNITRELHRKNAELENISKVKNQFLGIVCHDLRTPLSSMGMLCGILQDDIDAMSKDELLKYLEIIQNQIRFMVELIRDVLDISVIESGSLTLRYETYDISEEIRTLSDTYRLFADKIGVELLLETDGDEILIRADRNKIKQVVDNIVGNALKYSISGHQLFISLRHDNKKISIAVKDTGPGIPYDKQREIFQPFSTFVVETPRGDKSSGLGLAICKKITEAHGGEIRLVSAPGEGSEFIIILDRHPVS